MRRSKESQTQKFSLQSCSPLNSACPHDLSSHVPILYHLVVTVFRCRLRLLSPLSYLSSHHVPYYHVVTLYHHVLLAHHRRFLFFLDRILYLLFPFRNFSLNYRSFKKQLPYFFPNKGSKYNINLCNLMVLCDTSIQFTFFSAYFILNPQISVSLDLFCLTDHLIHCYLLSKSLIACLQTQK